MRNLLLLLAVIVISAFSLGEEKASLSSFTIEVPIVVDLDTMTVRPSYDAELREYLARLIFSEASTEPLEGKVAVLNVIQNRSTKTGRSIIQVVERRGQFDGRWTEQFYSDSVDKCQECYESVDMALRGYKVIPTTVVFYHNPVTSTDSKWLKHVEKHTYSDIGNHRFCHHPDLITSKEKVIHGNTHPETK